MLAACQGVPPRAVAPVPTANVPRHAVRFVINSRASQIRVLVYRAGPLANFGHNHVIVGHVRGDLYAGASAAASGFRLEIPVDSFVVDPPAARAEQGFAFAANVSPQARAGTRAHMLGPKVLDASAYPIIRIASVALSGPRWNPDVTARVTLRGTTRELHFPAAVVENGGTLTVIARFRFDQSEFGIQPYSILDGGLRVRNAIDVRLELVAQRTHP